MFLFSGSCWVLRSRWAAIALACGLLLQAGLRSAAAQDSATTAVRDAEYDALAQEVAELERQGNLLKRVVRLVTPTVVHIQASHTEVNQRGGRGQEVEETGSGVVIAIDRGFYVLTNRHVVRDALLENIHIRFHDGRHLHPVNVWADPDTDIAVLELSASDDLVAARLGNSEQVEIGDFVLALGSPFGLSHSVTYGIISAKGRRDLELGDSNVIYQDFLQTDAAINPGNSGGPLLNLRGEVIGINTAIASASGGNEGIGFAIPVNMVMFVARQLVENDGRVVRAFLGVRLDSHFDELAATEVGLTRLCGARISGITPDSPAEVSRLEVGDIILRFNDIDIEDDDHLVNLVSVTPIGETITLMVLRSGELQKFEAVVTDRSNF